MKTAKMLSVLIIVFNFILTAQTKQYSNLPVGANQTQKVQSDSNGILSDAFKISGQVGVYGELYTISGKEGRRPPSTGRLFFRPTITLLDNFNIAFDILLSTEGSYTRQQLNRISLHPNWGWGKAHIGDFSHQFSKFTLNGPTITGGGLEINTGIFKFEVVGGRTQRKINAGLSNSAYARYLGGIKLGIGKSGSSFFDINVVRIWDDVASLPEDKFTQNDESSTTSSQFKITPKENLVTGFSGNLNLFNTFKLYGEISGSVYTRDKFSNTIESEEIPNFVNNIYKVRNSTNVDYAFNSGIDFKYNVYNAKIGYSVINPGYTSLGLTTNLTDRRTINFSAGVRLLNKKLSIRSNYRKNTNNLLSQKPYTLSRTNFGVSARYQPIREVSLDVRFSSNITKNDASRVEKKIYNVISLYSMNAMWRLSFFDMNHTLTANISNQHSEDRNILRIGNKAVTNNINFGVSTMLNKYWTVSPRVSLNIVDIRNKIYRTTSTYNLMVSNKMLNLKFRNSLGVSYMNSRFVRSSNFTLQSGYSVTSSDIIKLSLRSSFYWGRTSTFTNFNEYRGSITITHRF